MQLSLFPHYDLSYFYVNTDGVLVFMRSLMQYEVFLVACTKKEKLLFVYPYGAGDQIAQNQGMLCVDLKGCRRVFEK